MLVDSCGEESSVRRAIVVDEKTLPRWCPSHRKARRRSAEEPDAYFAVTHSSCRPIFVDLGVDGVFHLLRYRDLNMQAAS